MKSIFKSVEPILVVVVVILVINELIFPALTAKNTLLNYSGSFLVIALGLFLFTYIKSKLNK
jgi:hypothetical protein